MVSLSELRRGFEPAAAALAARRADPHQCRIMAAAVSDMVIHGRSGDLESYLLADKIFHRTLLEASGNEMFRALNDVVAEMLSGRTHHEMMPDDTRTRWPSNCTTRSPARSGSRDEAAAERAMRAIIDEAAAAVADEFAIDADRTGFAAVVASTGSGTTSKFISGPDTGHRDGAPRGDTASVDITLRDGPDPAFDAGLARHNRRSRFRLGDQSGDHLFELPSRHRGRHLVVDRRTVDGSDRHDRLEAVSAHHDDLTVAVAPSTDQVLLAGHRLRLLAGIGQPLEMSSCRAFLETVRFEPKPSTLQPAARNTAAQPKPDRQTTASGLHVCYICMSRRFPRQYQTDRSR